MTIEASNDRTPNSESADRAHTALDAFAAAPGRTGDIRTAYTRHQVGELISALLHYVDTEDNPTDVLARALAAYEEQACGEDMSADPLDCGFRQVGGEMIAAVLQQAQKDTTTDPMNTLMYGLLAYNERRD